MENYKKRFHKKRKKEPELPGLAVRVYNNNIEFALKKLKRKVKDSNLMIELKSKSYYLKPSAAKRQQKNLARLRNKYKVEKERDF